jgi:ribosomal protein S12 methylthiotransferase
MGCAKNIVDSEKLMAQLHLSHVEITSSIDDADIAVINTCGFIEAAKEESIDMILENVRRKAGGKLKKVYAMGCLTERYAKDLEKEIPEVDRFFGSSQLGDVLSELGAQLKYELLGERMLSTPSHFAYLKISEGCDNPCSFCAIPIMRGTHVSRPIEDVVREATSLVAGGVKELIVIGQDTTYYGLDLYRKRRLAELLQRIADIPGVAWVRVMYAYPAKFPLDVLDVLDSHPKLCRYLDMPVQHSSTAVLRSMHRGITGNALHKLINTIRDRVPDIALRTTLIVGYPDETPREFEELLRFVEKARFERLGVFTYSQEDGTTAYGLGDPISENEKEHRKSLVMELQKEISENINSSLIGSRQRIIIDEFDGESYLGRTERDAPEIDNEVIVTTMQHLAKGSFVDVDIVDASEYDIYGKT